MVGTRFLWWGGELRRIYLSLSETMRTCDNSLHTCRQPESVAVPDDIETSCGVCSARAACKY